MTDEGPQFELPRDIDHYLAVLSKVYAREREHPKQEIIVNARVRVHEEWTSDNWNGGTYGHALYLTVPENLYVSIVEERERLQSEIESDLNKIHNVQGEFIAEVFIEMEKVADRDWRRESGALLSPRREVAPAAELRIWGGEGYRVFLSHKAEVKTEVAGLKERLRPFGISAFVAHTDIHPTKEWQGEIENALASMDAFVALLTEKFHSSHWTDQEVGFALGRGVPLVAVKLGLDPYGFIGKFQALACDWKRAPLALAKLLIKQPRMLDAYVEALPKCTSFDEGNMLSQVLPSIETLTVEQAGKFVSAFNTDSQLQGSFGFTGERPGRFGVGLAAHLTRATGKGYQVKKTGEPWPREWKIGLKKQ